MKRYTYLWEDITSFANLFRSARQAEKGKRFRGNVLTFNFNIENELIQLQEELQAKTYQPGAYNTFKIHEPKLRLISAAPYRDRVVHHALCAVITPIFEKTFIHDTYANRVGYGTHRALERFTSFARSSHYVLQCDIRKYFPSIDREILKTIIRRKIQCPDTLWLIDAIIDNGNDQESSPDYFPNDTLLAPVERKRGLPIGNLTSQWFANIYLSGFDHFVKEQLKVKKYLRYVDDFALFADDRYFLQEAQIAIVEYLNSLRLKLHPIKTQITATRIGVNFVGFRILPDRIKIRTANLRRARVRLKRQKKELDQGKIDLIAFKKSLQSWQAHLQHADTYRLRQNIFESLGVTP